MSGSFAKVFWNSRATPLAPRTTLIDAMSSATQSIDRRSIRPQGDAPLLGGSSDVDLLDAWTRDRYSPALAALVERYSVMVLSVCRRRCRSEADAEDAYQTTFLYLARNSGKIRRPECLAGWLQRVAQRAAVATLHASKRETQPMVEPPADPDDPFDRLTQRHEAIVLDEELAELPEHYRATLVMHCYDDRPLQILAEHFGTTVGVIRGRLQRGKQLLARRLRHRGVVPVVAFASAHAWTVSSTQAATAADQFIESTAGDLPDAPIDTPLLESLLSNGVRLMPSLYTLFGLLGGSALIAGIAMNHASHSPDLGRQSVITMPGEIVDLPPANLVMAQPDILDDLDGSTSVVGGADMSADMYGMDMGMGMGGSGSASGATGPASPPPNMQWARRTVAPTPTGAIARAVMTKLDEVVPLNISTRLVLLPQQLASALEIPVLLDERGMAYAKQDGAESVVFEGTMPLRTALRTILRPLGLKAVVEEEGLVITADPAALVHKGVGVNRWINIDQDAEQAIADKLRTTVQVKYDDLPLSDVVEHLRDSQSLPLAVDQRSLEEIGLSGDVAMTLVADQIQLRSMLDLLLIDQDLTYTVRGESLVITTEEAAENSLISRIYWLEGTGLADTDFQSVIDILQTTMTPDTWEALGGPSTMSPLRSARPALIISTTYTTHHEIEQFFEALRETHFGSEPVLEQVQIPASLSSNMLHGGAMDGGGFGGGGIGGGGMF